MKVSLILLALFVVSAIYFVGWAIRQKELWKLVGRYPYAVRFRMFFSHSNRWLGGLREEHRKQIKDFACQLRWRYWAFMALAALLFSLMWVEFI